MQKQDSIPIRVALTDRNSLPGADPIFPANYYDIPGLSGFQDTAAADRWALRQLAGAAGRKADLYINGGPAPELLSALRAMEALSIEVRVFHWDSSREKYVPQPFCWHPAQASGEPPVRLTLCRNRHGQQEGRAIFDFDSLPDEKHFDFRWQEQQAEASLAPCRGQRVEITLTGLKSLQVSVLNTAYRLGIPVTWLHYDIDTEAYFPQNMDASI